MPDLLHISDLHFGPAFLSDRAAAVLDLAERLRPEAVVVTGDFTQRAKRAQYAAAREFLDRFRAPVVVTPGNHDVPLYRVAERFLASHRNYREYIRDELNTVLRLPGCTIVALDSTRRLAFTEGRLRQWQLELAAGAFTGSPPGDLRIVATHHNLALPPDLRGGRLMPNAVRVLEWFGRAGVHLILAGHAHRAWVGRTSETVPWAGRDIPVIQCGTTTSSRGRGRERGRNTLNVIRAGEEGIVVTHYLYEGGGFQPSGERRLDREESVRANETGP